MAKRKKDKRSTKYKHKTKDRVIRTPLKTRGAPEGEAVPVVCINIFTTIRFFPRTKLGHNV
jgi:hypothetical protein